MNAQNKIIKSVLFIFQIVCFIIFQLSPFSGSTQSYKSLVQKGDYFYKIKSFSEAQKFYSEALKKKDKDLNIAVRLGECYWRCNKIYEANIIFNSIVNERNLPPSFYLYYGQSLRSDGNYREAKTQFTKYSQVNQILGDHFVSSCDWALRNGNKSEDIQVSASGFNSKEADFSPVYSGGKLFFSSLRNGKVQNFKADYLSAGSNNPPQALSFQGQNQSWSHFSFSQNQPFIAFSQINAKKNIRLIPESGFNSKLKWGTLTVDNLIYLISERSFSFNQGSFQYGYPFFTKDGNALYFASNREGGYGGMDLYVMYREGSNWTDPINLGPKINSQGDEISPFYQGNTLFFSSNWHPGFGGYDNFSVSLSEKNEWSDISNLGLPLNSPFDEFDFLSIGNSGFFTSNRPGGQGAEDIYSFKRKSQGILFKLVNALDGSPVSDVKIEWGNCQPSGKPAMLTNILGLFTLNDDLNIPCALTFSKEGFSTKVYPVKPSTLESQEIIIPLIRLGEIYLGQIFDNQSKQPLPEVEVTIENLANNVEMTNLSNENGVFEFALKPNATYKLSLIKTDYTKFSKIIKTTPDGRDRTVLGESFLTRVSEYSSDKENKIISNKGFSVQIVALSTSPPANQFSDLWSIADIYVKREESQVKIRMGVFKTQQEVLQALERVKQNGYPQAFIVEESNGPGFTNLVPVEMVETGKPNEIKTESSSEISIPIRDKVPPKQEETNLPGPSSPKYKIQLVALRDTRFFDGSKISHLGVIKDYPKPNNMTAKVIGDFTESNIREKLNEIKKAGFKDAFVVKESNGELVLVPGIK
jgi:tetratricopeptide (TPR) repeat protein